VKVLQVATRKSMTGEADFLAAARMRVTRASKSSGLRRLLVYGRNKKGKTTFGMSAGIERTLVIDPEHGTDPFKKKDPYVWHVEKWEDMQAVAGACRTGKLSPKLLDLGSSDQPFDWVCVDGLTRLNNMALRYVIGLNEATSLDRKPKLVQRQYYGQSGELLKEMMLKFQAMPLNVCYTAHERMMSLSDDMDDDADEEESQVQYFVPDLPAGVRSLVNGVVDVVGRIYVQPVTLKNQKEILQRRLYVGPHVKLDTGYRSDFAPPDMVKNPTIPKVVAALMGEPAPA
jgi:hypothetical protein